MTAKNALKKVATGIKQDKNYIYAHIQKSDLFKTLRILKTDYDIYRINAITGMDTGKAIELIYHITAGHELINLSLTLPRQNPKIQSIAGEFPCVKLYEQDLHEMLGIEIEGRPDIKGIFLPDDWEGPPPLLKTKADIKKDSTQKTKDATKNKTKKK